MKMQIVSVLDRAADAYSRPFYVNTIGQAIRSFADEVNRKNEENPMFKHPGDYDLYHLGSWDDNTGKTENLPEPVQIAIGKNCILAI